MKKFLLLFLSLGLGFSLVACDDDTTTDAPTTNDTTTDGTDDGGTTTPDTDNGGTTTPDTDNGGTTTPEVEEEDDDDAVVITYTISFDSNGGSQVNTATYNEDVNTVAPNTPTKTYNTFVGWQLNGEDFVWGSPLTGNITLTAVWSWAMVSTEDFSAYTNDLSDAATNFSSSKGCVFTTATVGDRTDASVISYTVGDGAMSNLLKGVNTTNYLHVTFEYYIESEDETSNTATGIKFFADGLTGSANETARLRMQGGSLQWGRLKADYDGAASPSYNWTTLATLNTNEWSKVDIILANESVSGALYANVYMDGVLLNESPLQTDFKPASNVTGLNVYGDSNGTSNFYLDNVKYSTTVEQNENI